MRNAIACLLGCLFLSAPAGAQTTVDTLDYAGIRIPVPKNCKAENEYAFECEDFAAQWLYFTPEMVDAGVPEQVMSQFEVQLRYSLVVRLHFLSQGYKFAGKKYYLRGKRPLKVRILAFGYVGEQAVLLNMAFRRDPFSNDRLSGFMRRFIELEE